MTWKRGRSKSLLVLRAVQLMWLVGAAAQLLLLLLVTNGGGHGSTSPTHGGASALPLQNHPQRRPSSFGLARKHGLLFPSQLLESDAFLMTKTDDLDYLPNNKQSGDIDVVVSHHEHDEEAHFVATIRNQTLADITARCLTMTTQTEQQQPFTGNMAAAALRQIMAQQLVVHQNQNNQQRRKQRLDDVATQDDLISRLLSCLEHAVKRDDDNEDALSANALADVLIGLARLRQHFLCNSNDNQHVVDYSASCSCISALAEATWNHVGGECNNNSNNSTAAIIIGSWSPRRALHVLLAVGTLELIPPQQQQLQGEENDDDDDDDDDDDTTYAMLCRRLTQGDALAKLTATDLFRGLTTLITNNKSNTHHHRQPPKNNHVAVEQQHQHEQNLVKALGRRLRKGAVRNKASTQVLLRGVPTLTRALRQYRQNDDDGDDDDDDDALLAGEIKSLAFTVTKDIVQRLSCEQEALLRTKTVTPTPMFASNFAWLCRCASELGLNATHSVVAQLCQVMVDRADVLDTATMQDVDAIVCALEMWGYRERILFHHLGRAVHYQARLVSPAQQDAGRVNAILRVAALLHARDTFAMLGYREACKLLFLDEAFLTQCSALQLANFVWFVDMARGWKQDEDNIALQRLGSRIMDADIVDSLTPKLACRILGNFAATNARNDRNRQQGEDYANLASVYETLFRLFDVLGEHLLSSRLVPLDLSNALVAYARAGYGQDLGIFDHLVQRLARWCLEDPDSCDTQQISQGLWACGKMVAWEQPVAVAQPGQTVVMVSPPYIANAYILATFLAQRPNDLSTKDTAQALWALAHLQLHTVDLVQPLSARAKEIAHRFNPKEVAMILWALGKMRSNSYPTIYALVGIVKAKIDAEVSFGPHEAANILYALGRLQVGEEALFAALSDVILRQIDDASAQAVSTALGAHRAVQLTPPRDLLDKWAQQKLGLVAVRRSEFASQSPSEESV